MVKPGDKVLVINADHALFGTLVTVVGTSSPDTILCAAPKHQLPLVFRLPLESTSGFMEEVLVIDLKRLPPDGRYEKALAAHRPILSPLWDDVCGFDPSPQCAKMREVYRETVLRTAWCWSEHWETPAR